MNEQTAFTTVYFVKYIFASLRRSYAYLDPGSGSFILQLILAILLGAMFVLRSYWAKIRDAIKKVFSRQQEDEDNGTK